VRLKNIIGRLVVAAVMGSVGAAWGDVLIKMDGTEMTGRVVAEDAQVLTFEQNMAGLVVRTKVARGQVKSLVREVVKGPGYCVLPLSGEVGTSITADTLHQALGMARAEGATYAVLEIDSPGGAIPEMTKILAVIKDAKDMTFIAHVEREAMSAAAIISLACPKIYMSEGAALGASVPFRIGPKGTPENLEAKFFSAVESEMRGAAELGGHSPLFVRGMCEVDVELVLRHDGSTPVVAVAEPGLEKRGERIIKQRGKILTMTASEAEQDGLSAGTLFDVAEIRRGIGLPDWHRIGLGATAYLRKYAQQEIVDKKALFQENLASALEDVQTRHKAAAEKVAVLVKAKDDESNAVKAEYAKALEVQHAPQDLQKATEQAQAEGNSKLVAINAKYDPLIVSAEGELRLITGEEVLLQQTQERSEAK
jgi:hypothetical protein